MKTPTSRDSSAQTGFEQRALRDAFELLEDIRCGRVNAEDEATKWLREYATLAGSDTVTVTVVRTLRGHGLRINDTVLSDPRWRDGQEAQRWVLERSDVESALQLRPNVTTPTPTEQHE